MEMLPSTFEINRVRLEFEANIRSAEANYQLREEEMIKCLREGAGSDKFLAAHAAARRHRIRWETWCEAWLIVTGQKWHGPALEVPPSFE